MPTKLINLITPPHKIIVHICVCQCFSAIMILGAFLVPVWAPLSCYGFCLVTSTLECFASIRTTICGLWCGWSNITPKYNDVVSLTWKILKIYKSNFFLCFKINLKSRFNADNWSDCKMSVHGTDCRVKHPKADEFWKYYLHKFYEVALCIQTNSIVWVNGHHPHINIFLQDLATLLEDGERVEAGDGYRGWPKFVNTPKSNCLNNELIIIQ